jgi:hypothetical protein
MIEIKYSEKSVLKAGKELSLTQGIEWSLVLFASIDNMRL